MKKVPMLKLVKPAPPDTLHYKGYFYDKTVGPEIRKCCFCGARLWLPDDGDWTANHDAWLSPPAGYVNCRGDTITKVQQALTSATEPEPEPQFEFQHYISAIAMSEEKAIEMIGASRVYKCICVGQADPQRWRFGAKRYRLFTSAQAWSRYCAERRSGAD